jgi:dolichyl-phosphate-mannose--protein O-mannosyl transferase
MVHQILLHTDKNQIHFDSGIVNFARSAEKIKKTKAILNVVFKYWRSTTGSLVVLVSVFLLIFKKINIETLTAIVAALIAAGYIPKSKKNEEEP